MQNTWANPFHAEECLGRRHSSRFFMAGLCCRIAAACRLACMWLHVGQVCYMYCREQALSNDYTEIMVDFILTEEDVKGMDYCVFQLDDQFSILYFLHTVPRAISVSEYFYNSIPKLYGLMQDELGRSSSFNTQNLTNSGILQVQRPPLSLTGKGVIIGFVDTGERVIILPR